MNQFLHVSIIHHKDTTGYRNQTDENIVMAVSPGSMRLS